jgi:hypothetical protein
MRVFVSYAIEDCERAAYIAGALAAFGIEHLWYFGRVELSDDIRDYMRQLDAEDLDAAVIISTSHYLRKAKDKSTGVAIESVSLDRRRRNGDLRIICLAFDQDVAGRPAIPDFIGFDRFLQATDKSLPDVANTLIASLKEQTAPPPDPGCLWLRGYPSREASVSDVIQDLRIDFSEARFYARGNYGELLRLAMFESLIDDLVASDREVKFVFAGGDYLDPDVVKELHDLDDPLGERWENDEIYKSHLEQNGIQRAKGLFNRASVHRSQLSMEWHHIKGYISPYAIAMIDDRIAYVSLDTRGGPKFYGRQMPTLRIDLSNATGRAWFAQMVGEVNLVDRNISRIDKITSKPEPG